MLKRIKQPMSEQTDHVDKIKAKLAMVETGLHAARAALGQLEPLLKQARRLGIGKDFEVMAEISHCGVIAGIMAQAELATYQMHERMTGKAKAGGVDTGGPLAVLRKYQPDVAPMDGGGGR